MANLFDVKWSPAGARQRVLQQMDTLQRSHLDPGRIIRWAGPRVVKIINKRTGGGTDVNDQSFRPYSAKYATKKKGGRSQPVTLQDTGQMKGLVSFRPTGTKTGKVFIATGGTPNRAAIGAAHHRGDGVPQRKWFGISPTDKRELDKDTQAHLENLIRGMSGGPGAAFRVRGSAFRGRDLWKVTSQPR